MKYRTFTFIFLILLNCVFVFGQTSYKGLTPGTSTRADVERVLGHPVKEVSETLIEYGPQNLTGKIFVQYRKDSAVVERIEMLCRTESSTCEEFITGLNLRLPASPDADEINDQKWKSFYGQPHFVIIVRTKDDLADNKTPVSRLALYSRELYEADVERVKQASKAAPVTTDGPSISGGVLNAKAIEKPEPDYPAAAKAMKVSGMVMVQVTVSEQGRVVEAAAVSGHQLLRQAAVDAARRARFNPASTKLTGRLTYRFDPE